MVEASTGNSKSESAAPMAFGYLADGGHPLNLHPLMANQIAAFAAASAIGFSVASQMAGFMFGGVQEAMRGSAGVRENEPTVNAPSVSDTPEHLVFQSPSLASVKNAAKSTAVRSRRREVQRTDVQKPAMAKAPSPRKPRVGSKANDLKRISGLGPKVEELLHKVGVKTFADIAAWTELDVQRIDRELGLEGRIVRDNWIGQAQELKSS